jgi:solute carrier family 10 (sodium/bile acid cotransporter), member 7
MIKQLFLPVGLLVAVIAALLLPAGGHFISDNSGLKIIVFIIFLVSGYQTSSKGLSLNRKLFFLLFISSIISLLLAPLIGVIVSKTLSLSLPLAMGLIIISTVPPTISSGVVITEVSRGNTVLALFLTITINIIGIFTMPFILDISLRAAGSIDIDQTALLLKMLFFVLLPFIIGKMIRKASNKASVSPLWSYINSGCVILMVYSSASTSKDAFTGLTVADYTLILIAVALVHLLLLAINSLTGKRLKLDSADNKAMLFVTSQKTLAIALAVLANINFETGSAIIVCLAFHFFQLFVDSALAAFLQKK